MHPLFQEIRCQLIDTRWRADGTADVRAAAQTRDLIRVSGSIYMQRSFAETLTMEGHYLAIAMATVLNTRKAVLVGKSAALVLGLAVKNPTTVELGLLSNNVLRKDAWPHRTVYVRDQIEPEDVLDIHGVRTVNAVMALAGVIKRGSFAEGLITADALRNLPTTQNPTEASTATPAETGAETAAETEIPERYSRLAGPWTKRIEPVWRHSRPGQTGLKEMSEVRALLIEQRADVAVNVIDQAYNTVPLVVNRRTSLRILENGPHRISVTSPSQFMGYRDVTVGLDTYRRDPSRVVNFALGRIP